MTEWGADVMMNQKFGHFACPPFLAKRGSHQDSPIPHSAAVPPHHLVTLFQPHQLLDGSTPSFLQGSPKKVAEHGPTTRDRGCYLLSLAPGVISRLAMVSPLTDAARAKKLSRLMHGWLSEDLQLSLPKLESTKGRIYTFAAFLGAP